MKTYVAVRTSSVREVVLSFLSAESGREKYSGRQSEFESWKLLSDQDLFTRVREFGQMRDDTNPLIAWTVGTKGCESYRFVRRWVVAEVAINSFYTCGLNPSMRQHLVEADWNLQRFSKVAPNYPEFRLDSIPTKDASWVAGIARSLTGREGMIELIDGAHRLVSMAHHGIEKVTSFVGETTI